MVKSAGDKKSLYGNINFKKWDGREKEGMFDNHNLVMHNIQEEAQNKPGSSSVIRILTKYVTQKYTDEKSVKTIIE